MNISVTRPAEHDRVHMCGLILMGSGGLVVLETGGTIAVAEVRYAYMCMRKLHYS